MERRLIASYGKDRILIADLCDRNQDEWAAGELLNLSDLLSATFPGMGRCRLAQMCSPGYCVEVEAVAGGFLAYERMVEDEA
jgi:hypothetical protein